MKAFNDITIDPATVEKLKTEIAENGIKFLMPTYVDMHGIPKTKMVPISSMDNMLKGSELFTGAALEGVPQDLSDDEVGSVPDPDSFMVVPWRKNCAWFSSDLWYQGKPFEACNRSILKNVLDKAKSMGYIVNCGIEAEFFVFAETGDDSLTPVSSRPNLDKPAYDAIRLMDNLDLWLEQTVDAMEDLDFGLYSFDHEDGIGQFELDFDYADALTMADRFVFLRVMVHEFARQNNCFSSFMPKPMADRTGSGAHYNVSMASIATGENVFDLEDDPEGLNLSKVGRHFAAGIVKHMPAILALVAPTVNSYKRLIMKGSTSGYTWAPVFTSWGGNNRSNTLRVPMGGGRVELRAADSASNPYLGFALMIAAGLEGVEQQLEPQPANTINLFEASQETRDEMGIKWLPRDLSEAIDALEADPLSEQVLGSKMLKAWVDYKREEWTEFSNHVSQWEMDRYLRQF